MKLQEIYDLGVQMGIDADPRGREEVEKLLAKTQKNYDDMSEKKKKFFDLESLKHPFSDSRLYYGNPQKEVKKVLVGIDVDGAELLLVDRLNQKGDNFDAVITHHPHGHGLAGLDEVMDIMSYIYSKQGMPENIAYSLMAEREEEIKKRLGGPNLYQVLDIARMLDIPFMSLHTTWDNQTYTYLMQYIAKRTYDNLAELLEYIQEIPEFEKSAATKIVPQIVSGSPKNKTGRILVEATGGTNPPKEAYTELAKVGVGTLVQMHIPDDAVKEMKKSRLNAIDIGHIAADSIGANLFLDELEKRGVEVVTFGGLVRVKRT